MTGETRARIAAAESVARRWGELQIPFLVVHGLEGYPDRLGRDLDILMPSRLAPHALEEARRVLIGAGWPMIACPPRLWGIRLVAVRLEETGAGYLEFHTMNRLRWMFLELGGWRQAPTHHIGPFPVHAGLTFCKAIVLPLLANDLERFDRDYVAQLQLESEAISGHLRPFFGPLISDRLIAAARRGDVEALLESRVPMRRAGLRVMALTPHRAFGAAAEFIWRKLGRLWPGAGARLRLELPRGDPAADALIASLTEQLGRVFLKVHLVTGPPSRRELLKQRYDLLSRQGSIVELHEVAGTNRQVRVGYRRGQQSYELPATTEATSRLGAEIAKSLIEEWVSQFPCDVHWSAAPLGRFDH